MVAVERATSPIRLHTDSDWVYQRVLRFAERAPTIEWEHCDLWVRLYEAWQRLNAKLGPYPPFEIIKVKSHCTETQEEAGVITPYQRRGNAKVDKLAGDAISRHADTGALQASHDDIIRTTLWYQALLIKAIQAYFDDWREFSKHDHEACADGEAEHPAQHETGHHRLDDGCDPQVPDPDDPGTLAALFPHYVSTPVQPLWRLNIPWAEEPPHSKKAPWRMTKAAYLAITWWLTSVAWENDPNYSTLWTEIVLDVVTSTGVPILSRTQASSSTSTKWFRQALNVRWVIKSLESHYKSKLFPGEYGQTTGGLPTGRQRGIVGARPVFLCRTTTSTVLQHAIKWHRVHHRCWGQDLPLLALPALDTPFLPPL